MSDTPREDAIAAALAVLHADAVGAKAETPPGPINDHERDCPDCQRVIAEERASWVDIASPETAEALARALVRIAYPTFDWATDDPPVMDVGDLSDSGIETPFGLADRILAAMRETGR